MSLFVDIFRTLLWLIGSVGFWIMDNVYSVLQTVAQMNIFEFKFSDTGINIIQFWQDNFMIFLGLAIAIRLMFLFISDLINPEKLHIDSIFKRFFMIVMCVVAMHALPIGMQAIGNASEWMVQNIQYMTGVESNIVPSTIIISSGNAVSDGYTTSEGETIQSMMTVTKDDIDAFSINDASSDGIIDAIGDYLTANKSYKYFPDTMYLMLTVFIGIYAAILFVIVGFDICGRWFELIALVVVSFIPISSIVKDGEQMMQWLKMFINIFLSNYLEYFLALISIYMMFVVSDYGLFVQIVFMLAGLLFTLSGSQKVSQLLGIETSGNTLQELANASMIARGIGGMVGGAFKMGASFVGVGSRTIVGGGLRLSGYSHGGLGINNYGNETETISHSEQYNNNGNIDNSGSVSGSGGGEPGGPGSNPQDTGMGGASSNFRNDGSDWNGESAADTQAQFDQGGAQSPTVNDRTIPDQDQTFSFGSDKDAQQADRASGSDKRNADQKQTNREALSKGNDEFKSKYVVKTNTHSEVMLYKKGSKGYERQQGARERDARGRVPGAKGWSAFKDRNYARAIRTFDSMYESAVKNAQNRRAQRRSRWI